MSDKFQNKYRIPSARLQNWDYGSNAMYFVTICTNGRVHYFGNIEDGKMILSEIGIIADVLWHEIKNHSKNVDLGAFVVMPNHVHGIIILNENDHKIDDITNPVDSIDPADIKNVETTHALSLPSSPASSPTSSPVSFPAPITESAIGPSTKTIGQQRFQNIGKRTLSSIVGSYKSAVSKHAHRLGFNFSWQSGFHDRIIWDNDTFQRISYYIINNPSNWKKDCFRSGC